MKPHPNPQRLFNRVTRDFFYIGHLDHEECHCTNKKGNGVLLIQCRHSGYVEVLPCKTQWMIDKAAAKWCAQTSMRGRDVPCQVITDSGKVYNSEWWMNHVPALESITSDVKSTHIERCQAKGQAAL